MKTLFPLFVALCSLLVSPAFASLPEFITYQGHVVDNQGEPLSGPFNITFRLYENENAALGEAIWQETQAGVPFSSGDFSVKIGSASAQSANPLRELAFDKPYWLGIEIESLGELLPRQTFEAVPFAYRTHDGVTISEEQTISGNKTFTGNVYGAETPGMIAMFDTSCPAGWTRFSAADGAMIIAGENYGAPQPAGPTQLPAHTHAQDSHGHLFRVDTPAPETSPNLYLQVGQGAMRSVANSQATGSVVAGTAVNQTTGSVKYITLVLCKKG